LACDCGALFAACELRECANSPLRRAISTPQSRLVARLVSAQDTVLREAMKNKTIEASIGT
jgi:hypothetical protein